jgi:hypothetical protein
VAVEHQLREPWIISGLVLGIIEEIPAFHKQMPQICHGGTMEAHSYIRPAHTRCFCSVEFVLVRVSNVGEVKDSGIVIILAREYNVAGVVVNIREGMLMGVPSPVTEI